MRFTMWDTLFNVLLLMFWFRIWISEDRSLYFNPYLAPIGRLSESVINFLRPVFFGTPPRLVAAIALAFLLLFRGMIFHGMAVSGKAEWFLRLGFGICRTGTAGTVSCLTFSVLSFAIFLFKLWGLSLIYVGPRRGSSLEHTTDTLYHLSRPFSDFRIELRPFILLTCGIILVFLLRLAGSTPPGFAAWQETPMPSLLLKSGISALAGWVDVLPVIVNFLMLLIIGSWVSMFASSQGIMFFCRAWIDLLLGPVRRWPIRIGMIDLTPIIFFFAVSFIHQILMGILYRSYLSI